MAARETTTLLELAPRAVHPEEEAQRAKDQAAAREAWNQARDRRPRVEAALLETSEMLVRIEGDIALAEAAVSAAGYALLRRVIKEQGGHALNVGGAVAVALDGQEANDPQMLLAQAHLTNLRRGRARLLEQREVCVRELEAVRQGPPPAAG